MVENAAVTNWPELGQNLIPPGRLARALPETFKQFGFAPTRTGYKLVHINRYLEAARELEKFCPGSELGITINEPRLPIPGLRDPRIFIPHVGHGQSGGFVSDEGMEHEGLTDALCIISYLEKYNKLFEHPSARNYYDVIDEARTGTGPFYFSMRYLFEERVSPEFISLLHLGYPVARMMEANCKPDGWFLSQILKTFCRDNYPGKNP